MVYLWCCCPIMRFENFMSSSDLLCWMHLTNFWGYNTDTITIMSHATNICWDLNPSCTLLMMCSCDAADQPRSAAGGVRRGCSHWGEVLDRQELLGWGLGWGRLLQDPPWPGRVCHWVHGCWGCAYSLSDTTVFLIWPGWGAEIGYNAGFFSLAQCCSDCPSSLPTVIHIFHAGFVWMWNICSVKLSNGTAIFTFQATFFTQMKL